MAQQKAITIVETRRGCAMFEDTPRYDVLLHGKLYFQLYFNMRGYVGYLPTPDGTRLNMGECGIGAYRKEAARLNREFAATSVVEAR